MESGAHFQLVPQALFLAHALGRPTKPLLERFGLPEDADAQEAIWMEISTLRAFLDAVAEHLELPQLGLALAENVPRGGYGLLEHSARAALTLGEAAAIFTRYLGLPGDAVSVALELDGRGHARFVHRVPGHAEGLGPHGNVFALAYSLRLARELTGAALPAEVVTLADARHERRPLERWFGTRELELGAGYNAMSFPASALQLPVVSANRRVHQSLTKILDQLQPSPNPEGGGFGTRLERAVREQLSAKQPVAIEHVAARMGMSARTLQRRLSKGGASYQELVESVRKRLAEKLLADPAVPIADVSFRLGYADVRSFARAFRRWKGETPGAYRRENRRR